MDEVRSEAARAILVVIGAESDTLARAGYLEEVGLSRACTPSRMTNKEARLGENISTGLRASRPCSIVGL